MDILAEGRRALAELGIDQWQGGYPHREAIEIDRARGESYVVVDDLSLIHISSTSSTWWWTACS